MDATSAAATAAAPLIATLLREREVLADLARRLENQMTHFRAQNSSGVVSETEEASALLGALGRYRSLRDRQARMLARVMGIAWEGGALDPLMTALQASDPEVGDELAIHVIGLRTDAARVHASSSELAFAFDVASRLVRDMIEAVRQPGPEARIYTAGGPSQVAPLRQLVDRAA